MAAAASGGMGRLLRRGVVRIGGGDAERFLQGLVTADLTRIEVGETSYGAFLNNRGRVECDALLTRADDGSCFLADVTRGVAPRLVAHLRRFALRADVAIDDASDAWHVCAALGAAPADPSLRPDPRLRALGRRGVVPAESQVATAAAAAAAAAAAVQPVDDMLAEVRAVLGVPEGDDFDAGPVPLDMGVDLLNGVSFDKGCYLGQELVARTYHTGQVRKRVTPFLAVDKGESGEDAARALLREALEGLDRDRSAEFADEEGMGAERQAVRLAQALVGATGGGGTGGASGGASASVPVMEAAAACGEKLSARGKKRAVGSVTSCVRNVGLALLRLEDVFGTADGDDAASIGAALALPDGRAVLPWQPSWWAGKQR